MSSSRVSCTPNSIKEQAYRSSALVGLGLPKTRTKYSEKSMSSDMSKNSSGNCVTTELMFSSRTIHDENSFNRELG